jgi:hypothetical protein
VGRKRANCRESPLLGTGTHLPVPYSLAGAGQVLARAVWSTDVAFVPFVLFWIWTGVVLLAGRFDQAFAGH